MVRERGHAKRESEHVAPDYIEFSIARRDGLCLIMNDAESLPSSDYTEQTTLEALAVTSGNNSDITTSDMAAADTLRIMSPMFAQTLAGVCYKCRSDYRLQIAFEGPNGRDYFAVPDKTLTATRTTNLTLQVMVTRFLKGFGQCRIAATVAGHFDCVVCLHGRDVRDRSGSGGEAYAATDD